MKKTLFVLFFAAVMTAQCAFAAPKPTTLEGSLSTNPRGSATFFTVGSNEYSFDSDSKIGKKVWKVCELEYTCIIKGVFKKDTISSIVSVTKGSKKASQ